MLTVRENEIALRTLCGVTAQLHTFEGTLLTGLLFARQLQRQTEKISTHVNYCEIASKLRSKKMTVYAYTIVYTYLRQLNIQKSNPLTRCIKKYFAIS